MPAPLRLTVVAAGLVVLLLFADVASWATWKSAPAGSGAGGPTAGAPPSGARGTTPARSARSAAANSGHPRTTATTKPGGAATGTSGSGGARTGGVPVSVVTGPTATTAPSRAGRTTPTSNGVAATEIPPPAEPGTYVVQQSGSVTSSVSKPVSYPPQGTLVVQAAQSDGQQVWQRYLEPNSTPSNTIVQFGPAGPHIVSMSEAGSPCTFPAPGIPAPPWPPAAGQKATVSGQCGSGSSSFRLTLSETVQGLQSLQLANGSTYPVWVINTAVNITGSNFTASGTQVDYYSMSYRLPLRENISINGTYDAVLRFALNSSSTLESVTPTPS